MKREEYFNKFRKFNDEEFLELYKLGKGDQEMAQIFNVSSSSIRHRRMKFKLISNIQNPVGKTLNREEIEERRKEEIKYMNEKRSEKRKRDPELRKREGQTNKEWAQRNRKKTRKYCKKWYDEKSAEWREKNRIKIRLNHKKWRDSST